MNCLPKKSSTRVITAIYETVLFFMEAGSKFFILRMFRNKIIEKKIRKSRCVVLRNQSNISDGAFYEKLTAFSR